MKYIKDAITHIYIKQFKKLKTSNIFLANLFQKLLQKINNKMNMFCLPQKNCLCKSNRPKQTLNDKLFGIEIQNSQETECSSDTCWVVYIRTK